MCRKKVLESDFAWCVRKHEMLLKSSFWKNSDKMLGKAVVEKNNRRNSIYVVDQNIQVSITDLFRSDTQTQPCPYL